jgi:putative ABC transport system permease protein
MKTLNKKLLRDLWKIRGQAFAIALVMGSGVAVMVMSLSSLESLKETAAAYYDRYRFGHVFVGLERAPKHVVNRINQIQGVQTVETRISKFVTLSIVNFEEPIIGQINSLPDRGSALLNLIALRKGRLVAPGSTEEVVISENFAHAHKLNLGDYFSVILNGNKRKLRIVGLGLSPEFVYSIGPGALMPDDKRYGILWMSYEALAAAFDLESSFNHVSIALLRNTNPKDVISKLDSLLENYGGIGAITRQDQISNWFLENELKQLRSMAETLPVIFILIAAFLTQMVLTRLISIERSEIGLLKAFGYSGLRVGLHYFFMVIIISCVGILLGSAVGLWLGKINTELYAAFFKFPFLIFRPSMSTFALSAIITLIAVLIGTSRAVQKAISLPPAEAMRPPAPPIFKKHINKENKVFSKLDQPSRIILRQVGRWPLRSLLTSLGIAMSVAVLVMSFQWSDSIQSIINTYFYDAQRQDLTIVLAETENNSVIHDVKHLPGVLHAEPARMINAEFHSGHRFHRGSINGVPENATLSPLYDNHRGLIVIPKGGIVLASALANKLEVKLGDSILIKLLEGRRPEVSLPITDVIDTYIGMPAYIALESLNRIMKEPNQVEIVNILIDENLQKKLFRELKETPKVSSVMVKEGAIRTFENTMAETIFIFISFFTMFACALAFGLVYNSTRIALSERGRELATLRVLGFSNIEISYILLGEMALFVLVSLPLGCLIGYGLAWLIVKLMENELYRIPIIIFPDSYGISMSIIIIAAIISAMIVQSKIRRLNLLEVLKTRE